MGLLLKRVKRGLYTYRRSSLFCALTIFASICAFVAFTQSGSDIAKSYERLCEDCLTSDFTLSGSFDEENIRRITSLTEVDTVSARLTVPAQVDFKGNSFLTSLHIHAQEPTLDTYKIVQGKNADDNGVLLSYGFAGYNDIKPGDTIEITSAGSSAKKTTVNGLYISASEAYAASVNELNGMSGSIILFEETDHYSSISLKSSGSTSPDELTRRLEEICPKETVIQQTRENDSFVAVNNTTGDYTLIGSFIGIIILLIGVTLAAFFVARLITSQSRSIAILKSLSYPDRRIIGYYVLLIVCFSAISALLGTVSGFCLSRFISGRVCGDLMFPAAHSMYVPALLSGPVVVILVLIVAFFVSLKIIRQPVSKIFNLTSVKRSRHLLIERIGFLWKRLSSQTQNSIRTLLRHKIRGLASVIGIALGLTLCTTVLAVNYFNSDYSRKMMNKTYDFSLKVSADSKEALSELLAQAEKDALVSGYNLVYEIPCTLSFNGGSFSGNCMIVPEDLSVYKIYSETGELLQIPQDGFAINRSIADYLGASANSEVELKTDDDQTEKVTLRSICSQHFGEGIFISQKAYIALFGSLPQTAEILIRTDEPEMLASHLEKISGVRCTDVKKEFDLLQENNRTSALTFLAIAAVGTIFSLILFLSLTSTSITEREREIIIKRSLGISRASVISTFVTEWVIFAVLGLIICLPLSKTLIRTLIDLTVRDHTLLVPHFVPGSCVAFASLALLLSIVISLLLLQIRLSKLHITDLGSQE